jgi:hypothetical protein
MADIEVASARGCGVAECGYAAWSDAATELSIRIFILRKKLI